MTLRYFTLKPAVVAVATWDGTNAQEVEDLIKSVSSTAYVTDNEDGTLFVQSAVGPQFTYQTGALIEQRGVPFSGMIDYNQELSTGAPHSYTVTED